MSLFLRNLHPVTQKWVFNVGINGGSVDRATINLVDRLVTRPLANSGLLNQMIRLNVCVGNLAASFVPLINNGGSVSDVNNGFVAADYSQNQGWKTNGTTKYLNTTYAPTTALCIGGYLRTSLVYDGSYDTIIGSYNTTGIIQTIAPHNNGGAHGNGFFSSIIGGTPLTSANFAVSNLGGIIPGYYSASRTSSTLLTEFFNGNSTGTNATATVSTFGTGFPFFIMAQNSNGLATDYLPSNSIMCGYHIAAGLSNSDYLKFYQIMQTFHAALNRQV